MQSRAVRLTSSAFIASLLSSRCLQQAPLQTAARAEVHSITDPACPYARLAASPSSQHCIDGLIDSAACSGTQRTQLSS